MPDATDSKPLTSLKEMLLRDFDQYTPISGGHGTSESDAIVIHHRDVTAVENSIISCFCAYFQATRWDLNNQELLEEAGRYMDILDVVMQGNNGPQHYIFFFDVTESIVAIGKH
jgi:hypothetical protein